MAIFYAHVDEAKCQVCKIKAPKKSSLCHAENVSVDRRPAGPLSTLQSAEELAPS
jgi:hypothetical protein